MNIIILGGYHNGECFSVSDDITHIKLAENYSQTSYESFSESAEVTTKVHSYRKVQVNYIKDYHRSSFGSPVCFESYKQMEDIGLFVPSDTPYNYEKTLLEVFSKLLNAEFKPIYNNLG